MTEVAEVQLLHCNGWTNFRHGTKGQRKDRTRESSCCKPLDCQCWTSIPSKSKGSCYRNKLEQLTPGAAVRMCVILRATIIAHYRQIPTVRVSFQQHRKMDTWCRA